MTTELLKPGYSNVSCTEDQCAFSGAVMSTELEVSIDKKDKRLVSVTFCFSPLLFQTKTLANSANEN